jgi:hypothetical protein
MRYQTALARHGNGSPDIVTGYHSTRKVGGAKSVDVGSSVGFELVFEYDESEELKV